MIEVKNQFARNLWFWVFVLPFVFVLLAPALLSPESLKVPEKEIETLRSLGREVNDVSADANKLFEDLFVSTGLVQASHQLFKSPFKEKAQPDGAVNAANLNNRYVEGFWHLIYRAVWRFMGLWPVLSVLLVAIVLPALVDGIAIRGRKLDQFKPHNPVFFWASAHSAISVSGVFFVLPLLPMPISVLMLYGAVAVVAGALWVTASNLQTGT